MICVRTMPPATRHAAPGVRVHQRMHPHRGGRTPFGFASFDNAQDRQDRHAGLPLPDRRGLVVLRLTNYPSMCGGLSYYFHTAFGSCSHRVVRPTEYGTESPLHID